MNKCFIAVFAASVVIAGCQKPAAPVSDNHAPPASNQPISLRGETRDRSSEEGTPGANPSAKPAIPKELETEGYSYYGLSNMKPLNLKIVGEPNGRGGAMTTELVGVENGKAKFRRSWGELGLPETELVSDATGVYVTSWDGVNLPKPVMELPAKLTKGYTWKVQATFDVPQAGKVTQTGTDTVIGPQTVTVAGKPYEAILVEEKGTLETSAGKQNIVGRQWFVKDLGPVRQEIVSEANGKKQTKTIEIAK